MKPGDRVIITNTEESNLPNAYQNTIVRLGRFSRETPKGRIWKFETLNGSILEVFEHNVKPSMNRNGANS